MDTKKMNFTYLISCTMTWAIMIFMNYAAGSGWLFDKNVGEVSSNYPTLITPAGFTFSIWGIIYILWTLFLIQLWRKALQKKSQKVTVVALYFISINILNSLWIYFWTFEMLLISVVIILLLLLLLIKLSLLFKAETVPVHWTDLIFVHWTIGIYLGWIILASVLNISVYLKSIEVLSSLQDVSSLALLILTVSTLIYVFLIVKRNMRETGLVGMWGFFGIFYAQKEISPSVAIGAAILGMVIGIFILWNFWKNKNLKSSLN
jgi:tryptophan-rich sensory protein